MLRKIKVVNKINQQNYLFLNNTVIDEYIIIMILHSLIVCFGNKK